MSLFITIIKVVLVTLYIAFMGQVVLFPIQSELHRLADWFEDIEVTRTEEKDDTIE